MTLIELMVAATVMSLVAVVMGGLVTAVDTARRHVDGLQTATSQGRLAIDRIRDAVGRAGVYRIGTGATIPGVAVVQEGDQSAILVVWTGGRESNFAEQGLFTRRPKASELVIYMPDTNAPEQLVEIVVNGNESEVDFGAAAAQFAMRIGGLINSVSAEKITLCDRLREVSDGAEPVAAIRFAVEATPSTGEINTAVTDSSDWRALPWVSGASTRTSGLRQLLVRIEIQIATLRDAGETSSASLPLFGAAELRYQHYK